MNFFKQTRLKYQGPIPIGDHVLSGSAEEIFKPKNVVLPEGLQLLAGCEWKAATRRQPIQLPLMPTVARGGGITFYIRNQTGTPLEGAILVRGVTPRVSRRGHGSRRQIIGQMRLYGAVDSA